MIVSILFPEEGYYENQIRLDKVGCEHNDVLALNIFEIA